MHQYHYKGQEIGLGFSLFGKQLKVVHSDFLPEQDTSLLFLTNGNNKIKIGFPKDIIYTKKTKLLVIVLGTK